ncbi:biotin--[acetyl-CoA-carboxylase] ligase [Flavobacteriaceae bacterium TP-CH-4]|uniref:Biotin--[acetyl-CoA-carboxylase] ligase n=1 Tax=Pelagihabitans pacificus TaxID=2696054 RepID=A0A967AX56_9FLAO|nr:biotin--[acetyl-CoA-carboxylase] ligase [Pelagihabitans pacificus]NHF60760.1 biotin--[acetyl-CoA-carboxylase] ligase [Pelagihabitans pacificus]
MKIVKLDAIDSTSSYLKQLMLSNLLDDFFVVTAKKQLSGRGQMGTKWNSEPGKNLTASILKKFTHLPITRRFYLNMVVSLAVFKTLEKLGTPNLSIKWPNDILSGNFKICGILIENMISGDTIKSTIIGIGLNVNQTAFPALPNASSLKLLLGREVDLDELLMNLIEELRRLFLGFETMNDEGLQMKYEARMFRKDKPSAFELPDGNRLSGSIRGVSAGGKLIVEHEKALLKEYGFKEVKLLY